MFDFEPHLLWLYNFSMKPLKVPHGYANCQVDWVSHVQCFDMCVQNFVYLFYYWKPQEALEAVDSLHQPRVITAMVTVEQSFLI